MDGVFNDISYADRADKPALAAKSKSQLGLVVAICLFLVLDCSILGINFYITVQVERDAQAINISGRQRMLSQRLTKTLLLIEKEQGAEFSSMEELRHVYLLFSSTLKAFYQGGIVTGGDGKQYEFEAIADVLAQQYIGDTQQYFEPIALPVSTLIEQGYSEIVLIQALDAAQANNLEILKLMNNLTYRMEQLSKNKTLSLRWIQTVAFFFALCNFILIIYIYQKRSRKADSQLQSFLNLIDGAATSIIVLDSKRKIILANKMAQEMFGYEPNNFQNLREKELFKWVNENCFALTKSGTTLRVDLIERSFSLHDSEFIILTVNDISSFTEEQERLAFLANHDALTGLVNRRALFDRLDLEILHAKRAGEMLGVFFLDLDGFKPVNDKYGHAAGDDLLKQLANRVAQSVRETDTVARFGGDEFVIVITGAINKDYLAHCCGQIKQVFETPFITNQKEIKLGCSMGMAHYPDDAVSSGELIELADKRMYSIKASTRNNHDGDAK